MLSTFFVFVSELEFVLLDSDLGFGKILCVWLCINLEKVEVGVGNDLVILDLITKSCTACTLLVVRVELTIEEMACT